MASGSSLKYHPPEGSVSNVMDPPYGPKSVASVPRALFWPRVATRVFQVGVPD